MSDQHTSASVTLETHPPLDGRGVLLRRTFASLKHRNYRLWFWGQMTSLFGTWMQMTAQGYLIYQLTHSAAFLGYVGIYQMFTP